jgi:cysteine desulfurase
LIYLDFAATTPISDESLATYNEVSKKYYGNSQSIHNFGIDANSITEIARRQLGTLLNCNSNGIYFTSGGSEANYLTILSIIKGNKNKGNHIITTQTEHSSISNLMKELEMNGYEVTYLKPDSQGRVPVEELIASIKPSTLLASINFVNSEIGTIQDIKKIGKILKEHNVIFHTDSVQAFGKININVEELNIDALSVASHKIYGPKGIGFAYISPRIKWLPLISGTTHQKGFRPGTLDIPSIAAMVTAATNIINDLKDNHQKFETLNKYFLDSVNGANVPISIYGTNKLPNIIGFSIKGIEGQYLMLECDKKGIAISTGSACKVGLQKPSSTILAIGKSSNEAREFVRISFGKLTNTNHIDKLIDVIKGLKNL